MNSFLKASAGGVNVIGGADDINSNLKITNKINGIINQSEQVLPLVAFEGHLIIVNQRYLIRNLPRKAVV